MRHLILSRRMLQLALPFAFSLCVTPSFADCTASSSIPNVPLFFYSNPLGTYNISLSNTLTAIANGSADNGGNSAPYFAKTWRGACPGGLQGNDGTCNEYTIYPNDTNFSPSGIMEKIEQDNNNRPNRGEVRVLTDSSETHYVYTTDHEKTFCGPYAMPVTR